MLDCTNESFFFKKYQSNKKRDHINKALSLSKSKKVRMMMVDDEDDKIKLAYKLCDIIDLLCKL